VVLTLALVVEAERQKIASLHPPYACAANFVSNAYGLRAQSRGGERNCGAKSMREISDWTVFSATGKGADWRYAHDREKQTYPTPADVFLPIGLLALVVLSLALVGQILIATQGG
jgi:hypothetical protein